MTTIAIRKKVHQFVDDIDNNELLEAVYNMLRVYTNNKESVLTKEQRKELDKTLAEHKAGKLTYHTIAQAKEMLYK